MPQFWAPIGPRAPRIAASVVTPLAESIFRSLSFELKPLRS